MGHQNHKVQKTRFPDPPEDRISSHVPLASLQYWAGPGLLPGGFHTRPFNFSMRTGAGQQFPVHRCCMLWRPSSLVLDTSAFLLPFFPRHQRSPSHSSWPPHGDFIPLTSPLTREHAVRIQQCRASRVSLTEKPTSITISKADLLVCSYLFLLITFITSQHGMYLFDFFLIVRFLSVDCKL